MPETIKKNSQKEEVNGENSAQTERGSLGSLLIKQREKKGWTRDQVAEITRLRRHYIEDIENERWDKLPPAVFVRGFLRSYAKTLQLDAKEVLELYELSASPEIPPPVPLVEPPKRPKKTLLSILVFLLIAAGVVFVWRGEVFIGDRLDFSTVTSPEPEDLKRSPGAESMAGREEPGPVIDRPEPVGAPETALPAAPTPPSSGAETSPAPADSESTGDGQTEAPLDAVEASPSETAQPDEPPVEASRSDSPDENETAMDRGPDSVEADHRLSLQGDVRMRTWVRICVDNQGPKEYIFQPGSKPQWEAKEGFHVMIGNAAGMDFYFNGKKFGDLGNIGQVVRLRFPEGFESTGCGE